jgi:hypothetical protein
MKVRTEAGWVQCNRQNTRFCTAKNLLGVPTYKPIEAGADGVYDWDFRQHDAAGTPWAAPDPIGGGPAMAWTQGQGYSGDGTTTPLAGVSQAPLMRYLRSNVPGPYPTTWPTEPARWRLEWEVVVTEDGLDPARSGTYKVMFGDQVVHAPTQASSGPQVTYLDLDTRYYTYAFTARPDTDGQGLLNFLQYTFYIRSISVVHATTDVPFPWHAFGLPAVWDGSGYIDAWEYP